MQLSFTVDAADIQAFLEHQQGISPLRRWFAYIYWAILGLLSLLVLVTALRDTTHPRFIFWSATFVIWALTGRQVIAAFRRLIASRTVSIHDWSAHLGTHSIEPQDDGLHWVSPAGASQVSWSAITRVAATGDHTFIYLGDVSAVVVPHRDVTAEALEQCTAQIRERVAA